MGAVSDTSLSLKADYVRFDATGQAFLLPPRLVETSAQDWWVSRDSCSVLEDVEVLASHCHLWLLEDCPRPSVCIHILLFMRLIQEPWYTPPEKAKNEQEPKDTQLHVVLHSAEL